MVIGGGGGGGEWGGGESLHTVVMVPARHI